MSLAHPAWLLLLALVPLLAAGALVAARFRGKHWNAFSAARLRPSLLKRGSPIPRWLAFAFLLAALVALIAALSRPQGDAGTRTDKTTGRNLLVALDLSKSMRVADVNPDRLAQAKVVIYELLEAMPEDRIGLIGFAGTANLYAPLTIDHNAVRETVEQIDDQWAPVGGSDLASAVQLAISTFKQTGQKNNALIILSDGEHHRGDLPAMIAEAERSGVYIFAIGVGTENGGFVPDDDFPNGQLVDRSGRPVLSRLNPEVMRRLATDTGGRYAVAGSGQNIPALIRSASDGLDAFEMKGMERKISIEFYQWLLFPAVIFLFTAIIAGTRWRKLQATALVAGLFLLSPTADAGLIEEADRALRGEKFGEARDTYKRLAEETSFSGRAARYRIGEGLSAYRARDFRGARSAFSGALLSDEPEVLRNGHLGMANTLFQLGWMGLTDESYPTDPELLPNLETFDGLVKDRLAAMLEDESSGEGFTRFRSLILNWADAIKHDDSALAIDPGDPVARQNRETTLIYLKRLEELLQQEKEETQQSLPQEGEGEPNQEGEGEGEGQGGPDNRENPGDHEYNEDKGDPNESPEERARRRLSENADQEKGPLSPGQRELRSPEKDW